MRKFTNKNNVLFVAKKLDDLKDEMVFIGGAIIELLLDQQYPLETRISYDVDTVIEVATKGEFAKIEARLRKLGFKNDIDLICRWSIDDILVDIMPTEEAILGFSCRWYKELFVHAEKFKLSNDCSIKLATAPYLLATKLEAFEGRGNNDYLASRDMEDLITVIDGRESLLDEILAQNIELKTYLSEKFEQHLTRPRFHMALPGHLSPYSGDLSKRITRAKKIIAEVVKIKSES